MRYFITLIILITGFILNALPVSFETAKVKAVEFVSVINSNKDVSFDDHVSNDQTFYLFKLKPQGFVIMANDNDLPPVIGYSFENNFSESDDQLLIMNYWLNQYQSQLLAKSSSEFKQLNRTKWSEPFSKSRFQQWPEEGSTPTGGWVVTNWTQTSPYNNLCPIDQGTNTRSIAGCPSIAMGQIVNYHRTINNTRFNANDAYLMYSSNTNQFPITGETNTYGYPAFTDLNNYLSEIENIYAGTDNLNSTQKAALVLACGLAIKQSYSSEVSGNYFHNQVINGFHRFGFNTARMLAESDYYLYERMADNMKNAMPAQICVLNPDGAGHQIVVDGYNTNDAYHFNFGWGGSSNGWYSLPLSGMPYELNLFGTIVVDINQDPESFPDADLQINSALPLNHYSLSYQISNNDNGAYYYHILLDNELINDVNHAGQYSHFIGSMDNGFHKLSMLAFTEEGHYKMTESMIELKRGNQIFSENFDQTTTNWEIICTNNDYSWQLKNNSLESFSAYDTQNLFSLTCPVAYQSLSEQVISPSISLPQSDFLKMSFYVAYSDAYPQYPGVTLKISNNDGQSWNNLWQSTQDGDDWRWHQIFIDLSEYAGQTVKLQFVVNGFSYCDVSIDAIQIYDSEFLPTQDIVLPAVVDMSVYPNPVRMTSARAGFFSNIDLKLDKAENVQISIYDIKGRKINTLVNNYLASGKHQFTWNGLNQEGKAVASGIYFVRMTAGNLSECRKLMILK